MSPKSRHTVLPHEWVAIVVPSLVVSPTQHAKGENPVDWILPSIRVPQYGFDDVMYQYRIVQQLRRTNQFNPTQPGQPFGKMDLKQPC